MDLTAFVTGADRGLGYGLCANLLKRGWTVYAGQYLPEWTELNGLEQQYPERLHRVPLDVTSSESARTAAQIVAQTTDRIDMLINNAGVTSPSTRKTLHEEIDYAEMERLFATNSIGPLRVVDAFLPLMDRSSFKRLCFVSSEAGSIKRSQRTGWFGYCMSKSALNMAVKLVFNQLRPEGYSFRLYHPGWMRTYMGGQKNLEATLEIDEAAARAVTIFLRKRNEDRLVLIDYQGHVWPW